MSPELAQYISSLPISTFLLANDRQLIGRKVGEDLISIYVSALCSIETLFGDDNSISQMMMPLIPHSIEETASLYRTHIVVECPASLKLKKSYCDTLLKTKISNINGLNSLSSLDLDTTNQISKPEKPFNDRWN